MLTARPPNGLSRPYRIPTRSSGRTASSSSARFGTWRRRASTSTSILVPACPRKATCTKSLSRSSPMPESSMWTMTRSCSRTGAPSGHKPTTTVITADMREPHAILGNPAVQDLIHFRGLSPCFSWRCSLHSRQRRSSRTNQSLPRGDGSRQPPGAIPSDHRRAAACRSGPNGRSVRGGHFTHCVPDAPADRPTVRRVHNRAPWPGPPLAVASRADRHHAHQVALCGSRERSHEAPACWCWRDESSTVRSG